MTYKFPSAPQIALASLVGLGLMVAPAVASPNPANASQSSASLQIAQTPGTIVDVASSNDAFDTLVTAVGAAGLVDTLSSEGPFTVFAPTDDAFAALPPGVLDALLLPENRDLLTDVLTYHVVPDEVLSSELETGGLDTLNGGLAISVSPDRVVVNNASVIIPDVPASNGVIHAINRVLIPTGLVDELNSRMAASSGSEPIRGLW